jgi:hypothetical protein
MQADQTHARIFRMQSVVFGIIMAVGTFLNVGKVAANEISQHHQAAEYSKAEDRADFWRIVAGKQPARSANVKEVFAASLSSQLGPTDATATSLPDELKNLNVGANQYSGIDKALGFNPFDNQGVQCRTACGHLSSYMQAQLLQIKQGGVDNIIQTDLTSNIPSSYSLWPYILAEVVLYLGGGMFAMILAVKRDSKTHDYAPQELNWKDTGGTVADRYKKLSYRVSPAYFWVVLPYKKGDSYQAALKQTGLYADHTELLDILKRSEQLPKAEAQRIRDDIMPLLQDIDTQVGNVAGVERVFKDTEAQAVSRDISETLQGITQRLKMRHLAMEELEAGPESNELSTVLAEINKQRALDEQTEGRPM